MTYRLIIAAVLLFALFFHNYSFAEEQERAYQLLTQTFDQLEPEEKSSFKAVWDKGVDIESIKLSNHEVVKLTDWLDSKQEYIQSIDRVIEMGAFAFPLFDISTMDFPRFLLGTCT